MDVDSTSTIDVGTDDSGVIARVDIDTTAIDAGCGVGQVGIGMGDGGGAATQTPPGCFLLGADRFVVAAFLCGGDGGIVTGCDVNPTSGVDLCALGDKVVASAHVQIAADVHAATGFGSFKAGYHYEFYSKLGNKHAGYVLILFIIAECIYACGM